TQIEFERLKPLINKPEADLAAGKFACFFDDDWPGGLGRLANCTDAKIKDAAMKDLANPKGGAERMALANAWWEIAQKQTPVAKNKFEARARYWYRSALPNVGGLDKVHAEKRIAASLGVSDGATAFNGHWYLIMPTKVSWPEARLSCQLLGGHLACIESSEEWKFAMKL